MLGLARILPVGKKRRSKLNQDINDDNDSGGNRTFQTRLCATVQADSEDYCSERGYFNCFAAIDETATWHTEAKPLMTHPLVDDSSPPPRPHVLVVVFHAKKISPTVPQSGSNIRYTHKYGMDEHQNMHIVIIICFLDACTSASPPSRTALHHTLRCLHADLPVHW